VSGATGRASTSGAVHVPAIVRAAVLDTLTREQLDASVIVAAGAATQAWGARGATARIVQQLRDCVVDLYRRTGTLLLVPEIHPALLRAGRSMTSDGLADSATAYWQSVSDGAARALGADHPSCVAARAELARALQQAGKLDAALALLDRVLADRERIGGHADPETAAARVMLMDGCELAGRRDQALAVCRRGLAEAEAALGPGHPATFGAREDLARACLRAGRTREAIALYERTLADRERVLGPDHPDTARSRAELTALGRPGGRRTGPSHVHSPAHDR
jgi:tetratricopeptide (TPR) repeat protein